MAQIATQIFVLPTAVLGVGVHGPFVSPQVGAAFGAYQLTINQGLSWPTTAGSVMDILVEYSQDGGTTWNFDLQTDTGPAPWFDKDGVTPKTSGLVISSITTAATDLFRITLTVHQACGSPTFTMAGLQ